MSKRYISFSSLSVKEILSFSLLLKIIGLVKFPNFNSLAFPLIIKIFSLIYTKLFLSAVKRYLLSDGNGFFGN